MSDEIDNIRATVEMLPLGKVIDVMIDLYSENLALRDAAEKVLACEQQPAEAEFGQPLPIDLAMDELRAILHPKPAAPK